MTFFFLKKTIIDIIYLGDDIVKVFIGADHGAKDLERDIINYLKEKNIDIESISLPVMDGSDDFTDYAYLLCNEVLKDKDNNLGILICRDGIGMSIVANKVKDIICARVLSEKESIKAKNHSGANVIALGSENNVTWEENKKIVDAFINTSYPTEERRIRRVSKIIEIQNGTYNGL